MIRGGAHVGGVVVVSDAELLQRVLGPVYAALELEWDPGTAGSVSEELGREIELAEMEEGLIAGLSAAYELEESDLDQETLAHAERIASGAA
jgi:lipoate-protein ligase A